MAFGLLIGGALFAQSGWVRTGGGSGQDDGEAVAVDPFGNVFVTGEFQGSATVGGIPINSNGGLDMFVAKYSPVGNVLWVRTGGSTGGDEGRAVTTDSTGNVYITGFFSSNATFSGHLVSSEGGYDMFVIKYDANGNFAWLQSGGGYFNDDGYGIAVDNQGNCYVAGGWRDEAYFDDVTLASFGGYDGFVAKYDASGSQQWVKRVSTGCDDDRALRLQIDGEGFLRLGGYFYSTIMTSWDETMASRGSRDAFYVGLDQDGNPIQTTHIGGTGEDSGNDTWVDALGNVYYAGHFSSTVQFSPTISLTSVGLGDLFLAKYDPAGNALWARQGGGGGDEYGMTVAGYDNGVFLGGPFLSIGAFSDTFLVSSGDYDVVVAKYTHEGDLVWARKLGGTERDYTYNLCADPSGNVYVAGHFTGTATFDDTTITGYGSRDFFVVKIASDGDITGIADDKNPAYRFNLSQNYPNPFNPTTEIQYTLPSRARTTIQVYNTLGQLVRTLVDVEQNAGQHTASWDGKSETGEAVSSGVYVIRLDADGSSLSRKITLIK